MESSTGAKREELARVLVKYEETLKMLEAKNTDLQKEADDVKESEKEKKKCIALACNRFDFWCSVVEFQFRDILKVDASAGSRSYLPTRFD